MINLTFPLNVLEYYQRLRCRVWFIFNVFLIEIWLSETHTTADSNTRNASHITMCSNNDIEFLSFVQQSWNDSVARQLMMNVVLIWKICATVCSVNWYSVSLAILSFSGVCSIRRFGSRFYFRNQVIIVWHFPLQSSVFILFIQL